MTREEAIRQIENRWSIMDYGESEALGEALDIAIESLSADTVSRSQYQSLLNAIGKVYVEVVRCEDCKYFKLDHFDMIDGVPIIIAHEICTKWSGGSKTNKDGFCFMGERREQCD